MLRHGTAARALFSSPLLVQDVNLPFVKDRVGGEGKLGQGSGRNPEEKRPAVVPRDPVCPDNTSQAAAVDDRPLAAVAGAHIHMLAPRTVVAVIAVSCSDYLGRDLPPAVLKDEGFVACIVNRLLSGHYMLQNSVVAKRGHRWTAIHRRRVRECGSEGYGNAFILSSDPSQEHPADRSGHQFSW